MGAQDQSLQPGTLPALLHERTEAAQASGALTPIPTSHRILEQQGIRFQVRVVESLARKDAAREAALPGGGQSKGGEKADPFLPHDEALFVADVSGSHVALLNKFNVLDDHLLIVTRSFVDQRELLGEADFEALWRCLDEVDGLGFYNGGEEAGASQPHKHLQVVPLPLTPGEERLPVEAVLPDEAGRVVTAPALPFCHALYRFTNDELITSLERITARTLAVYHELIAATDLPADPPGPGARQRAPYNLLATREWMLLVRRSQEFCEGISVNAIGFAGGLLVRSAEQLARVEEIGPMQVLAAVGVAL